ILDIRYSLEDIRYRLLLSQRMILLYVLLYGSVLVGIGYYLLQRNIIKPARNLLQATEDVSRGHLGTRLPVAGPVEIAHLATAYNQMVDALEHSRSETQSHIAALQQTNKDLQQAREELIRSEKLASVGQLAAGLAHELGNPLAALTGYLEVLKLRITSATELDVVTRSITEAGRIDFLVCELLDFSRPGENQTELLSPAQELRSVVQLLQHQGSLAGVETVDHLGEGLPRVQINRHKLQQLFVNLLLNATQACAGQGQIRLSAGQTGNVVWLTIADNGCGIATDQLGRIFDPFYTTKEPGEGTGLGLSICHRIVDEAGGKILAESDFGKGSSFRVEFPALV
ncbi:MAG TPA: ATP-binding protein, partial [Malonomonas sp.]